MTLFYIDTTSNYLYTALFKDNHLLNEKKECLSKDLSTFSVDEINKMFQEVNLSPKDVDKIMVVNGPGSFTGIRIGVTIAKVYAYLFKKEITTITSLEAMAKSIDSDKLIVPIINARRDACYAAIYDGDKIVLEGCYLTIEKLTLILKGLNKDYLFISNDSFSFDTIKYDPNLEKIITFYQNKEGIDPHFVNPLYLKLTEAEENKMKEVL